jgi:hypothetical protein
MFASAVSLVTTGLHCKRVHEQRALQAAGYNHPLH